MVSEKNTPPISQNEEQAKKQKKTYLFICAGIAVIALGVFSLFGNKKTSSSFEDALPSPPPETASLQVETKDVRLSAIEYKQENMESLLTSILASQKDIKESIRDISNKTAQTSLENAALLEKELTQIRKASYQDREPSLSEKKESTVHIISLEANEEEEKSHVSGSIPAGTMVRCVLVSAADCSVGVQQPKGPAKMLLRPLSSGKLPRNVRVALKDSMILASAYGDLANERVYVRADRMTLVHPNGDFVETEISAYVSGEDGREGVRGIVVDRSGAIIARAAFASTLQGIASGIQASLNNQTLSKLSKESNSRVILDVDTFRNAGVQGATTGLNKLADYYIKRAEQLQPSIQVASGRIVDLIFTRGVKIGEKDLKKKLEIERSLAKEKKYG